MPRPLIDHSAAPSVHELSGQTKRFRPTPAHMPQSPNVVTPVLIAHSHPSSVPHLRFISPFIAKTCARSSVPSAPVRSQGAPISPLISEPTTIVVRNDSTVPIANTTLTDVTIWNRILSRAIKLSGPQNNVSPGRVESSLPSDGIHRVHSPHLIPKHSSSLTPSNQTLCPTLHLNEVIQSRRGVMKPSSFIIRHLKALMGSMMGRSNERSRSGYDGLIRSLMGSVIDGKRSRSSHQGLMRSLMEISD